MTDGWDTSMVGTLLSGLEPSKPELSIADADVTLGPLSETDEVDRKAMIACWDDG